MKLDIPYNMEHEYNELLHEVPKESMEMEKGVAFILDKINEAENDNDSAHLHSNVGVYLRILNRLDESEKYLKEAIRLFKAADKLAPRIQADIRLASTKHWQKHFFDAEKIFNDCLKYIEKHKEQAIMQALEDYCLYFKGKMRFEQGQLDGALEVFSKCHELRLIRGDQHLMDMAAHCMHVVKEKKDSK